MASIVVYSGPNCPYCDRAKMLLKQKGIAFEDINVRANSDHMAAMLEKSNGRRTIPQIFIDGSHIGGCDDLFALDKQGKLDAMLAG
jgi:glutaredoxin 3